MTRKLLRRVLLIALLVIGGPTVAQDGPPLKLLVGYSPGGGVDALARTIAAELSPRLSRAVVVENRPGAGGSVAAEAAARSQPDGNTVLLASNTMLLAPHMYPKAKFDPLRSFVPVAMLGLTGLAVAVPANSQHTSLQELIDAARAAPGKFLYASAGVGTMHHLGGELIKSMSGIDLEHVPYKGGSQAAQDLAAGMIDVSIASLPAVMPHAATGRVRILAVLSPARFPILPDVPAVAEILPGFDATPALFLVAPAGSPESSVQTLNLALKEVLGTRALKESFLSHGGVPEYKSSAELRDWMTKEGERWTALIKKSGLQFK